MLYGRLFWCPGPESNRYGSLVPRDFLTRYGFRRPRVPAGFGVWTFSLPYRRRLRQEPSSLYTFPAAADIRLSAGA